MILGHGIEKRVGICDIETMHELFDVGVYDPDSGEWIEFEVSKYKNELYHFVKWYTSKPFDYLVTFNGINFDQQVMEWVVDNYEQWYDLDGLEIARLISKYAQRVIEKSNFNLPSDYKEYQFSIPPIDVFRIHHFDNEAKRTSLKWCAFMLNMDVEEMPIHFSKSDLNQEEIQMVRNYRRNDVKVTEAVLQLTLGNIDIPEMADYKGKNKIQDRFDVWRETGLKCLNWSDVKIGEEWNKQDYKFAERIKEESVLFSKNIKHPYGQKFKKFFPKTMEFRTPLLQEFIKSVGEHYVKAETQEFHITIGATKYTVAKGGLHSCEKNRRVNIPHGWTCRDADVGSQYPNSIVKLNIYAPHLKETIMHQFKDKISKRLAYKDKANQLEAEGKKDEARPYKSVQDMLKLCLNGGYYGKLGQKGSFLEYPEGLLKVCMGNQIEILMLIEMMEQAGFMVISGNTDGIVTMFPTEKEPEYLAICKEWEERVGNTVMGKLEYTDFVGLWQESVNSYIAKSVDDKGKIKIKKKGRFSTELPLNRNKSSRIIPLALEAYFIEGKDPIEFIKNHKSIYDFLIAKKASGQMYYEEQWIKDSKIVTKTHKKLVRYFVSKTGSVLYKRGFNNEGGVVNNHCEAPTELGQPLVTYFNKFFDAEDYNIDYDHYILHVLQRIDKIEKTNKAVSFVQRCKGGIQTSLF